MNLQFLGTPASSLLRKKLAKLLEIEAYLQKIQLFEPAHRARALARTASETIQHTQVF